ncbi:MAG TPA: ATP-binding protein [Actinomycetota bacterium]|nr:ATP-binding protein [Actinomycetota bacterium]
MPPVAQLAGSYLEGLRRYLARPDEASLAQAYELGRGALASGLGVTDLVAAHREALAQVLVQARSGAEAAARARAAAAFLLEALGPFEMALGGFREANESLRRMNARLEDLVRERTAELERTVDELRRVDRQRRVLLRRLTDAQEEERRLIANAFHDDAIQIMTAISMRLGVLLRRPTDPETAEALAHLDESLREAIARSRRLLFELRPSSLDRQGLAAAVRELLDRFADEQAVRCELDDALATEPGAEARACAFRIVEEALRNVRNHARARAVRVELRDADDGFVVRVSDDGRGFDPAAMPESPPGHLGLTAMRERAELAGGWCRIQSAPGAGTTVEAWLPRRDAGP